MNIQLHPELADRVRAAWATLDGLSHREHPGFREHLDRVCASLDERFRGLPPSAIPELAPARRLYRSVGMDPTRTRPSSEALLRRVLQGKGLYLLDPVVDTGNLFSLAEHLPLGLYDRDRLEGDLALRLGGSGEGFEGIRKGRINVEGRLCLADARGPFGSPSSDSDRTRIREETSRVLFLVYAPADYPAERLVAQSESLAESFAHWNGASWIEGGMLSAG